MRKEIKLSIALSLSFLMFIAVQCKKQDEHPQESTPPAKPCVVKGNVTNEFDRLLPGSVVNIQGNGTNVSVTAADGNFIFDSLRAGSYNLSVKKEGYIETSASFSISAGDTLTKGLRLKGGTAYLNLLSDSVIMASPYASNFTLKVSSNTSWVIQNSNSWLIPDKPGSSSDDSIMVRAAANITDAERQGAFVLQAGSLIKNIVVKQLPEVKLRAVTPMPGNLALGIKDSIALEFNQPVTVKSIFPGNSSCLSEIRYSYVGNKVTFSYACAALGGDYPFTITTNNSLGDQYTFTFSAGFYEKSISLTGFIQSHFVNDADNSYWIMTHQPNVLYKIDMTSFQILHRYDLPSEPVMFTINPYNNKIYLAYRGVAKLYILNQDGTTDQVIDMQRDPTRSQYEYNGPRIYPIKLTFTKNGKGMIWLSDRDQYSSSLFWYIDAAANHRIWYQSLPGEAMAYENAAVNHDKTKLVLTYPNNDPTIGIFDAQQMTFSSYKPSKYDIKGFVTPSRQTENVYVGQLYFQLIVDPLKGLESPMINRDNRNGGNVDFCYKRGNDQSVYFTEGGSMEIIDYTTRKSPVKYDALYYLKGTTATLDGKHIIVNWSDGNFNARVIQLPGAWFNY